MNYSEFYKQAAADKLTWKDPIDGVKGYNEQLPMLALLAGTGALGGYALANKKKRGAGALFGGASLPALYLAYLYGRRNGWLGNIEDNEGNAFDNAVNSYINDPANNYIESWTTTSSDKDGAPA